MTQAKLLDKLAKMKAMAEGAAAIGSEAEAQAFANALQRMLIEHKLKMTDIEFAAQDKEQPIVQRRMDADKYDFRERKARIRWIEQLGCIVADAHFCKMLLHGNSTRYSFVGREEDIAVAEYLFITLYRAAEKISEREYGKYRNSQRKKMIQALGDEGRRGKMPHAYGFKESFLEAFVSRLKHRLEEEQARHDSSTALMRINQSLAKVKQYVDKLGSPAKALAAPKFHRTGWEKGTEAANAVNLRGNGLNEGNGLAALPSGSVRYSVGYRTNSLGKDITDIFVTTPGTDEEVARRYEDAKPGRIVYSVKIFAGNAQ
jgi:hypothetical protein